MVSTRSKGSTSTETGEKRSAPSDTGGSSGKRTKKEKNGKLEVGVDGEVGLKKEADETAQEDIREQSKAVEGADQKTAGAKDTEAKDEQAKGGEDKADVGESDDKHVEGKTRSGPRETKQEARFCLPHCVDRADGRATRSTRRLAANPLAPTWKSRSTVSKITPDGNV